MRETSLSTKEKKNYNNNTANDETDIDQANNKNLLPASRNDY